MRPLAVIPLVVVFGLLLSQPLAGPAAQGTPTAAPVASPFAATPGPATATAGTPAPGSAWWDGAVCYEVFVRSFFDADGDGVGDLAGLTQKLDYINDGDPRTQTDLGASCIWLMPIFESPSYHGYDTVDYYAIDKEYGTLEDFQRLRDEARRRGIKVILDLVLNHSSSEHPRFQEALRDPASPYRDWYIWSATDPGYNGPWGQPVWHRSPVSDEFFYGIFWEGMPDLNYANPEVTAEARKVTDFWLDLGADGFRLDAIRHLIEDGETQQDTDATHAWLRDYRAFLDAEHPDAFTVGEVFDSSSTILAAYYPDQLHAFFQFEVGDRIVSAADTGVGGSMPLVVAGIDDRLPDQRWAPFLRNHDQTRTMTELNGDVAEAKMAATALLTMPGLPFVYYGEEIGMTGDKPDELIRTPMQWAGDANGGFTTGTPWEPLQPDLATANVAVQEGDPASLLNHYRRLINPHTNHPALARGDFVPLQTGNSSVAAFLRTSEEERVLVVLNFGKEVAVEVALAAEASGLAPGTYNLTPLLGDATAAPMTVAAGGTIAGYAPLAA